MDHDKQVKDLAPSTIERFLNRPLVADDRDRDNFDLVSEFAKTAKNKSPLIPLVVVAFLVVLAVGAWLASQLTEQASHKSTVTTGSFEDLKLKEIFDTARKNKKDLEAIQAQIASVTRESEVRVAALLQAGNSKADIASVNDASGSQARSIQSQTTQRINAEKAALKATLVPLNAQLEEAQKKVDSYDDRIGQLNKKNQQVLDTQQRLFDLEKKKITDQYEAQIASQTSDSRAALARVRQERDDLVSALKAKQAEDIRKLILKYNPQITEPVVAALIDHLGSAPAQYPLSALPARLEQNVSAELKQALADRLARTQQLVAALRAIPYENSVPGLINSVDNSAAEAVGSYNAFFESLAQAMTELDGTIAQRELTISDLQSNVAALQSQIEADKASDAAATAWLARWTGAVDDFVALLKEDGVFVDTRNAQDWIVVLKAERASALQAALAAPAAVPVAGKPVAVVNLAAVRDGLTGAELGSVTVESTPQGWRARLVKLNDAKKPFKPFDRVVLALPAKK